MESYSALVRVSLQGSFDDEIEYTRECTFPSSFAAVPQNIIALCKLDTGWITATIMEACAIPEYIKTEPNTLEIHTEIEIESTHELADLVKLLPLLGWKLTEEDSEE